MSDGRRVVRGPWRSPDPTPPNRPRGAVFPLLVAAAVLLGTQTFFAPLEPLIRLASGHRYLTQPLLAAVLPSGASAALGHLLRAVDAALVVAVLLLILGWGARAAGFDASSVRRGLPASLLVLLASIVIWSPPALAAAPEAGWWTWDLVAALARVAGWLRGFAEEFLFRGVLQAALVVGIFRLTGRRRPATAVGLGIALAAAWGALIEIPMYLAEGFSGWALAHVLVHRDLLAGLVLGAIYARTGDLVLAGGIHGAWVVMATLRVPGWPSSASTDLLLVMALLAVALFLSRGMLRPHSPHDVVSRSGR